MRARACALALAAALVGCQGAGVPPELVPRILDGDCVRVSMQTRAGAEEDSFFVDNLRARATREAGCGLITRLTIGGWLDTDADGARDPDELVPPSVHEPPGGRALELVVEDVPLALPEGKLARLVIEITVDFEDGRSTTIAVDPR